MFVQDLYRISRDGCVPAAVHNARITPAEKPEPLMWWAYPLGIRVKISNDARARQAYIPEPPRWAAGRLCVHIYAARQATAMPMANWQCAGPAVGSAMQVVLFGDGGTCV